MLKNIDQNFTPLNINYNTINSNEETKTSLLGKRKFDEIEKNNKQTPEELSDTKKAKVVISINNIKEKEVIEIKDDEKPVYQGPKYLTEYVYEGPKLDDKPHGFGQLTKHSADLKYHGSIKGFFYNGNDPLEATIEISRIYFFYGAIENRRANGLGITIMRGDTHIGFSIDGRKNGYGINFVNRKYSESGIYENGECKEEKFYRPKVFKNKSTYYGPLIDGKPVEGILKTATGCYYQGQFKDNKAHGVGLVILKNEAYVGSFVEGNREGKGIIYFFKERNISYYYGDFKKDKYDGKGTHVLNDVKYTGSFKDGLKDGPGLMQITSCFGKTDLVYQKWVKGKLIT